MPAAKERDWKNVVQKTKGLIFPLQKFTSQKVPLPQTCAPQAVACDSQKQLVSIRYREGTSQILKVSWASALVKPKDKFWSHGNGDAPK